MQQHNIILPFSNNVKDLQYQNQTKLMDESIITNPTKTRNKLARRKICRMASI